MTMRMRARTIFCAVLFTLSFLPAIGPSWDAHEPETQLVSVNSAGTASGNDESQFPAISSHGWFVTFESRASDLVDNDTNGYIDLFVRNLKTGKTALVSVNSAGTKSGDGPSGAAAISANERFVTFTSAASDLVADDTNDDDDVFVRDLKTGTTTLVSVNSAGTASGNGASGFGFTLPALSANGRFVAFVSGASDLVADDTNGADDVFVRDL